MLFLGYDPGGKGTHGVAAIQVSQSGELIDPPCLRDCARRRGRVELAPPTRRGLCPRHRHTPRLVAARWAGMRRCVAPEVSQSRPNGHRPERPLQFHDAKWCNGRPSGGTTWPSCVRKPSKAADPSAVGRRFSIRKCLGGISDYQGYCGGSAGRSKVCR